MQPRQPLPPDGAKWADQLRGMADRPFLANSKWKEQQKRADRAGVHPDIVEFDRSMVKRMAELGVPMFCSEMMRSPERQNMLFDTGMSKATAGNSAHQYGCALDLIHSKKGWEMTRQQWLVVGQVGQDLIKQKGFAIVSLAWGGDWQFYDPAHWQVANWREVKGWYPWAEKPARVAWRKALATELATQPHGGTDYA